MPKREGVDTLKGWIDSYIGGMNKGRKAVVAIPRTLDATSTRSHSLLLLLSRNDNEAYRHISYSPIYPRYKVLPTLRRNGFNGNFHDYAPPN
ncbi:hypothetical protein NXV47_15120 [Bacteroides uniformis]|nr:hypothetical protein [Bacteroides uniformis]